MVLGEAHEGLEELNGLLVDLALLLEVVLRVQQLVLDDEGPALEPFFQAPVVGLDDLELELVLFGRVGVVELQLGQHVLGSVVVLAQLELFPLYVVPQNAALAPLLLLLLLPLRLRLQIHLPHYLLRNFLVLVRVVLLSVDLPRGRDQGKASKGRNGLLLALRVSPFEFSRVDLEARVAVLVHFCEGVLGFGGRGLCEGRQVIILVQVVPFEVVFDLLVREGRAVVVEVLLDLSPVAEAPQLEGRGQHHLVHHVPAAVREAVPQGAPHQVLLREVLQVGEAAHAEVVGFAQDVHAPRHVQLALRTVHAQVGLFDDLS